ncbi:MAG: extracellular solute-binding protein [Lachnospiraceae bacterium]|nr:extracellular solute-binding protein [uncultured Acetatifactor sp.]MCI9230692.1 extracellular solute-binding protein [Lachnospiraceae bacterium]MCI9574212.1 extracellular solute-binding protein [Lachnospiraceae bacterium]
MKIKKVTAFFLAAAMAMSVMTGCGSNGGSASENDSKSSESKPAEESKEEKEESDAGAESAGGEEASGGSITFPLAETMEFTSFSGMNQSYTLPDTLAMQEAMSRANINITFDSVLSADLTEKRNLMLASGEYPDMLFKSGIGMGDLTKYGGQGILIPLEDLVHEYMPNLTAKLDEIDGWQYLTSPDGHIYSIPEISARGEINLFWLNKKWLDNLSLEEPKSMDDLYEVLKAFKEQDANGNGDPEDEIPFSLTQGDYLGLLKYSGFSYDEGSMCAVIDGKLTYVPTTDYFREYVAYLAKLYQEGLLEQTSFTQGGEQQQATGQSGDVYGSFWTMGAFLTVGRDNDDDYVVMTPFHEDTYPIITGIKVGTMAITDACEHPEVLMAWADYLYSEEGGILAWMGVEGKTYQVADNGKWEWMLGGEYGDDIATVRSSATIQGAQNHPSIQPDFWFEMSPEVDADEVYLNNERQRIAGLGKVPLPMMAYTEEDNAQIATFRADIDGYINQFIAQVCTGEVDLESGWDTYLETMEAMGASTLAELHEKTYNAAVQ